MIGKESIVDDAVNYLKKNLKKGYTKDSLIVALHNQGYSKMLVDKAVRRAEAELADEAPLLRTKPEIKYEVIQDSQQKPEKKKKKWGLFG